MSAGYCGPSQRQSPTSPSPQTMPAPSRAILVAAVGSPCAYCGDPMALPTRDHVRPRASGGTLAEPANRLLVCERCNRDKAAMSLLEFLAWLIRRQDGRAERVHSRVQSCLARGLFDCLTGPR